MNGSTPPPGGGCACLKFYFRTISDRQRQRFGEHLRSIEKNLPGFAVAVHFTRLVTPLTTLLLRGDNAQRKRLVTLLPFPLDCVQSPRALKRF